MHMGPAQHCPATEFLAVVRADDLQITTLPAKPVHDPGQRLATYCTFSYHCHRFVRGAGGFTLQPFIDGGLGVLAGLLPLDRHRQPT